jgi:hypothetical protein
MVQPVLVALEITVGKQIRQQRGWLDMAREADRYFVIHDDEQL